MTRKDFVDLYKKCISGDCTSEEIKLLEAHLDDFELIDMPWSPEMGDQQYIKEQITGRLHQQINGKKAVKLNFKYIAIAASLLVILSAATLFWKLNSKPDTNYAAVQKKQPVPDILPGRNTAILTLANGAQINLDNSKAGTLSQQNNVAINKVGDGQLVYDQVEANTVAAASNFNILSTPRGGQYSITLCDGTKVWLNAATTLKYPALFSGNERKVELEGEAYFEVAKNKNKPFKVSVNGVTVDVLGTHFNIMGYQDDNSVQTTLLEGSVRLNKGKEQAMLTPGQQAITNNKRSGFNIQNVNAEDAIAWKNGYFLFKNEDIRMIMKKISRWYDVDVDYKGELDQKNFGGSVSRFENVSELLKTIELTGAIHFKIEGRRIIVMP